MAMERLQKILASAGLGSRRSCEELILQGRVTVDGCQVRELGSKADPEHQQVACDGERVHPSKKLHFLVNKPRGYVCTNADADGRPRAIDLVPLHGQRLFTVGRLDVNTEGLLIITNDGAFAQRVAHPRHGVTKTYEVRVRGLVANATKRELTTGVWLSGRRCCAVRVKVLKQNARESLLTLTLHEGRNHEVRRMLAKVGHPVRSLRRIRIGSLEDPRLPPGKSRRLRPDELNALLAPQEPARAHPQRKRARAQASPKGKK